MEYTVGFRPPTDEKLCLGQPWKQHGPFLSEDVDCGRRRKKEKSTSTSAVYHAAKNLTLLTLNKRGTRQEEKHAEALPAIRNVNVGCRGLHIVADPGTATSTDGQGGVRVIPHGTLGGGGAFPATAVKEKNRIVFQSSPSKQRNTIITTNPLAGKRPEVVGKKVL